MHPLYHYVGRKEIADRVARVPPGMRVESPNDVLTWIRQTQDHPSSHLSMTTTFVVDEDGWLRIADRHSEHVACAGGRPVRSAGEMTFHATAGEVCVSRVTNQSTGYCPDPNSWPAVQQALKRAGLAAPDEFSQAFLFRRCLGCHTVNLIKDGNYECTVCTAPLSVP